MMNDTTQLGFSMILRGVKENVYLANPIGGTFIFTNLTFVHPSNAKMLKYGEKYIF